MPDPLHVHVLPAPGDADEPLALLRRGPVVAALAGPAEVLTLLADALLAAADAVDPGAAVASALTAYDVGAAVLVHRTGAAGGTEVVLRGDLPVVARTRVGTTELNGREADGVVRQPLMGTPTEVRLGPVGGEPAPVWSRLVDGVVPGAGAVVLLAPDAAAPEPSVLPAESADADLDVLPVEEHPAGQDAPLAAARVSLPPPSPDPVAETESIPVVSPPPVGADAVDLPPPPGHADEDPEPAAAFESVSLLGAQVTTPRAPLPTAAPDRSAAPSAADDDEVVVQGLHCARGHFNHPHAANCAWCGLAMLQASHVFVPGPRPPLGVLLVDGQATFSLDADYVVGRQPGQDPGVDGRRVRELVLSDPERAISRVHAAVRLDGWDVVVEDLGSGNGTWVVPHDGGQPVRLVPGSPRRLWPGDHVHVGPHRLTFRSHHLR
ncbi:MAG: hypothetical protein CMH83_05640 [Nocardioides sp.]|nr:hypothetical protein [Nocardioides sp.]